MSAESDAEHQKMAAAHADAMAAQRLTGQLEQQAAARAELAADLAALRRAGVKTFRGQGIDVEFFSADVPQPKEMTLAEKLNAPEMCEGGCGHEKWKHDPSGACVEGCAAEQCMKKEAK